MTALISTLRFRRWLVAGATLFMFAVADVRAEGQSEPHGEPAGNPFEITLTLETPSHNVSRFDVTTGLNTLVPGRGMDFANGSVDWTGSFSMSLYLEDAETYGMPAVAGVQLKGTPPAMAQSSVSMGYSGLPVAVGFSANNILSAMEQQSSTIVVVSGGSMPSEYHFAPGEFYVMQMSGEAAVAVETRPTEMQNLATTPLAMGGVSTASTLIIEPMDGYDLPTYRATFRMPMAGQMIAYKGTGLPVEFHYDTGALVASGMFSMEAIPEPSSIVLAGGMIAAAGLWIRRAG